MINYRYLAILLVFGYAMLYLPLILITNDTYAYATMVSTSDTNYPPLFLILVKIQTLILNVNENSIIWFTFLTGSIIALIILPILVYFLFEEYKKSSKIAFWGLFAYMLGTGITNYYYYANIWAQALGMSLLVISLTYLMKEQYKKAAVFIVLVALSHRVLIYYAIAIILVFLILKRNEIQGFFSGLAYCLYKTGEISYSLMCYIPMFLLVYPFFWIVTLRNITVKTINDKLFVISAVIPLAFVFLDLRTFLATFTFLSIYVGEEICNGSKRKILIIATCLVFAAISFVYTLDLANTAI